MDRLAFTGILLALLAIVGGFALEGGGISALFHLPAFLIVIGGSFGAVMLQSPSQQFVRGLKMFPQVWRRFPLYLPEHKDNIIIWSELARQQGFLSLEQFAVAERDPFLHKGLMLLVDGAPESVIKENLELEIELESEQQLKAIEVYDSLGGFSPTIGILGAVLGLIQAMTQINDPDALGAGIATAFVATIYGVGAANLLFIPIAQKLKSQVQSLVLQREMLMTGLIAISRGDNPRFIANRLDAYIAPAD